jgi:ankyrin repeat protein
LKILNNKIYAGKNSIEMIKVLIENDFIEGLEMFPKLGGDFNCTDSFGYTPLHWAAIKGRSEMASFLIDKGVRVEAKCLNYEFTALHCAINENQIPVFNVLILKGSNFMARDKDGNTPLHFASMIGNVSIVRKLLDMGANVNATDRQGVTPIFLANYCGQIEIFNMLINAGAK